jgi:hypothetical protein
VVRKIKDVTTRIISGLLLGWLLLSGCHKKDLPADCEGLRNSMTANDVTGGLSALSGFIDNLSSEEYTEANLDQLVRSLNNNCNIITEKICFGCIQTLPEQSEIRIHFINNGTVTQKTFDISRPANGSNMIVLNMHD